MTNMCLNHRPKIHAFNQPSRIAQAGAAILILTVILVVGAVMLFVMAANYIIMQQKTAANQYMNDQAFEAAEAGLEFGIQYLNQNASTVVGSASSGGAINYGPGIGSLTNVTFGNNSQFSVVITNPTANVFSVLTITSTGTNADGTSTRVVRQQVYSASGTSLQYAVTTQGNVITSGTGTVSGTNGIDAGGLIIQSGTWTVSSQKQNDSGLASESVDTLFSSIFNMNKSTFQGKSTVYPSTTGVPWSTLSGDVWINTSVIQSGNMTIGSTTNPVVLVVNGSFIASGNITINGLLIVLGALTTSGGFVDNGAVVTTGGITMSGSGITFNQTVVNNLTGGSSGYEKIPGSWRDF